MGLLFIYIIKCSLCLIVLGLAYRLFLSRETFYKVNRFVLLAILLASAGLPFMEITVSQPAVAVVPAHFKDLEQQLLLRGVQANSSSHVGNTGNNLYYFLFMIYAAGALIQALLMLINFVRVYRIIHQATHFTYGSYKLAITSHAQSPFSWGRYIVLSDADYQQQPELIIQHELVHLQKKHFLDLLLAESMTILLWFNPVIWLLKRELKYIHEFEVDAALLKNGVDARTYQLLLIKKAVGATRYAMVNTFSQSKLGLRIKMMVRRRSTPWAGLKYACIIVLTALSLVVFARPEISRQLKAMSSSQLQQLFTTQGNKTSEETNQQPAQQDNTAGITNNHASIPAAALPDTGISNAVNYQPHYFTDNPHAPLCMVDGRQLSYNEFQQLDPQRIATVKVLKEKEAMNSFGESGKNGAIIITLLTGDTSQLPGTQTPVAPPPLYVFFLNGKPVSDEEQALFNKQPDMLLHDDNGLIEKVVPVSGKGAVIQYGEKGKNGVVEVYINTQPKK